MTDKSRKAFESPCEEIRSFHAQLTDLENQNAALKARIAESESGLNSTAASLATEIFAKVELRATLDAIEREVGERPERLDTDSDAVYEMALSEHYKHAAKHAALKLVELKGRLARITVGYCGSSFVSRQPESVLKLQYISDAHAQTAQCAIADIIDDEVLAANAVKGEG